MLSASPQLSCYVDASTSPDNGLSHQRRASLGIFTAKVQPANHIYIRATLQETHSVIYAESAALALAAVVPHRMGCFQVSFFSDS
jgi:hypothetical protein